MESRKHNRLTSYNYNQKGAYFVTICTLNRVCTLSRIVVGDAVPYERCNSTACINI